jgi:hypothetical protein
VVWHLLGSSKFKPQDQQKPKETKTSVQGNKPCWFSMLHSGLICYEAKYLKKSRVDPSDVKRQHLK